MSKLCVLLLLLPGAATATRAAEQPALIKRVAIVHRGRQIEVRVVLSRPVTATMSNATAPERVLLDLPNTSSSPHQHRIAVDRNGVQTVRYGLNQSNPPVTRLVVDLQRAGQYKMASAGNEIVLSITPGVEPEVAQAARASSTHKHARPPAAANAPWINLPGGTDAGAGPTGAPASTPLPAPARSQSMPPASAPSSQSAVQARQAAQAQATQSQTQPTLPPPAQAPATPLQPAQPANLAPPASPAQAAAPAQNVSVPQSATAGGFSSAAPAAPSSTEGNNTGPHLSARPSAGTASAARAAAASAPAESLPGSLNPATPNADIRTVFRVKYVADGAVYLDGGSADGLAAGVALVVKDTKPQPKAGSPASGSATTSAPPASTPAAAPPAEPGIAAHLQVISVAQNSAVCTIGASTREVKPGDLAYLASADAEALVQQRALSSTRVYPQVISFTQGDPMDQEVRDEVPRPPLPEINRTRMMIGFDYGGISSRGGTAATSSQFGMVVRTDMTRIGGSYWNLHGYWRGDFNSQASTGQPTMQDLLNRTYTIGFTYDNPNSNWVAGVGRLYLPWATSLDVIDGGYGGRRFGKSVTAGIFAGSTPDPTSWSYNPDQRIAGTFVNFQGGSYQDFHYTSTTGMGVSTILWQVNRPFVFFENGIAYKRYISVYQALQADKPRGTPTVPSPGAGISRSYVTVQIQPIQRLSFDVNHNYFRDVPTYNLSLVGTGLLDKVLFQGFSVGARVETVEKIYLYTEQGRSTRSGDAHSSLNQMYGITFGKIWNTGLRADLHYAKFNSAFAQGTYRAISLSRSFGENFQGEVQVGKQAFVSPFSSDNGSKFLNLNLETQFGSHYFFAGGYNLQRGLVQNYDQWYFTLGYRFDNRARAK